MLEMETVDEGFVEKRNLFRKKHNISFPDNFLSDWDCGLGV